MIRFTSFFLIFFLLFFKVSSVKFIGQINNDNNFVFLTRFCFENQGNVTWNLDTENNLTLSFYQSSGKYFSQIFNNQKNPSCSQKISQSYSNSIITNSKQNFSVIPKQEKQYFFYLTISDCDHNNIDAFIQNFHIWNTGSSPWIREFSCEEQGLLPLNMVFLCFFIILTGFQIFQSGKMISIQTFYPLNRFFLLALILKTLGILFVTVYLINFASQGKSLVGISIFGEGIYYTKKKNNPNSKIKVTFILFYIPLVTQTAGILIFAFILILVSKGWTISQIILQNRGKIFIIFFISSIIYIISQCFAFVTFKPENSIYYFETTAGAIVILIHILIFIWFLTSFQKTIQSTNDPQKKKFFSTFRIIYSIWFLSLPFFVLLGTLVSPFSRQKMVTIMVFICDFLAFSLFSYSTISSNETQNYLKIPVKKNKSKIPFMKRFGKLDDLDDDNRGSVLDPDRLFGIEENLNENQNQNQNQNSKENQNENENQNQNENENQNENDNLIEIGNDENNENGNENENENDNLIEIGNGNENENYEDDNGNENENENDNYEDDNGNDNYEDDNGNDNYEDDNEDSN
ncbi:intimal thickness receptor-related [Anaeramoeba ignava]|uniref:Intimal thickness receptor-related n=1 Tax=Anaeramoeba ignava TaxID=1746090 RepID=A0A9Q0R8J5_ANAIG|nr:intimal thickness receptor-related [Anaeramoeba ignava]